MAPSLPPGGLVEGQTLAGKYRIERMLGAGGMCLVYEAEHVHLRQAIALKLLKPDLARDPTAVARFAQEAQAAAKLRSPNVARVYDVDKLPDGQPYITMELLVGHDLGTELQRRFALPLELAVDYVCQAANGMAEAHALGIVHRDLKPENLFLTELGAMTERRLLKILDFGIAKNVDAGARKLTADDAVFGTVDYMSPEQIRSASAVDHRSDLWSLGVILYELLTGRTPYDGDARSIIAQIVSDPVPPPSHFVPALPPALVGVIMKALSKDPNLRFQSAEELRHALMPFASGVEPIAAVLARLPAASVPRRTWRPAIENARDMRTNLSFENSPRRSVWERRVWAVPALGAALITLLGVTLWKRDLLNPNRRAAPQTQAAAVVTAAASASGAVASPTMTPSALPEASALPPDLAPAVPSALPDPPATHSAAKKVRPPPRASAQTPSPPAAAPPSATASALPKHL